MKREVSQVARQKKLIRKAKRYMIQRQKRLDQVMESNCLTVIVSQVIDGPTALISDTDVFILKGIIG